MSWGSQSWCRITKESTYGVFDASALTANIAWVRMYNNNACTIRAVPQRQIIRSADGGNRRRQVVASRKVVSGNINTIFYPSQAAFFLGAALTLSSNDLGSFTVDFFDTVASHRFLGCKVSQLHIAGTAQGDFIPLTVSWVGQSQGSVSLADPGVTVFPTDQPYSHFESKGHLTIGSTVTKYKSLGLTIKNTLDAPFDEDQWVSNVTYAGRDIDLSVALQYVASTLRGDLEAQTALTVSTGWHRASGLATDVDLKTTNYVATVQDDLPLASSAYQTVDIQAFFDQTASSDASFTVA